MLSFILVLLLGGFMPAGNLLASDKEQNPHYITVKNSRDLQAYFRYAPDRPIVISGHRGGMLDGYPENCIESFEKTLSYMESFFEIDPRLTKDGIIVFIETEKPVNVMYTVHNASQARYYLDRKPDAMFSCWCKNREEFDNYEKAGIPWKQVMAYVGPKMKPEQQPLYDALHRNGVMCMISVAPTHDRAKTETEKTAGYRSEISTRPDVIETDYPYLFQGLDLTK